jgi:hypothetical protein
MTAAAIATMATVEAATITAVSCPFACSRKRKRRAVRTRVRARMAQAEPASRAGKEYNTPRPQPRSRPSRARSTGRRPHPPWPLDELQRALTAADGSAPRLRSNAP